MANPPRPENHLRRFNQFLAGIDLAAYRARFAHIKLVELNLPREHTGDSVFVSGILGVAGRLPAV